MVLKTPAAVVQTAQSKVFHTRLMLGMFHPLLRLNVKEKSPDGALPESPFRPTADGQTPPNLFPRGSLPISATRVQPQMSKCAQRDPNGIHPQPMGGVETRHNPIFGSLAIPR